jgi:hypothetical protein
LCSSLIDVDFVGFLGIALVNAIAGWIPIYIEVFFTRKSGMDRGVVRLEGGAGMRLTGVVGPSPIGL